MSDFTFGTFRTVNRISLRTIVGDAALLLQDMLRARATRRMLREMDDRLLSDIGIGRGDAMVESDRPMWDLAQRRH